MNIKQWTYYNPQYNNSSELRAYDLPDDFYRLEDESTSEGQVPFDEQCE